MLRSTEGANLAVQGETLRYKGQSCVVAQAYSMRVVMHIQSLPLRDSSHPS
ncbi:hypothetical protein SAMN05660830_02003 [Halodesulfovibrio aestuarii]|uniref:Uncharacterized protein n=1 Tax=Halodesulfovibrio aestuarii TaxID=126333 RepID=A0A8G2CA68_9BACT|nr:hypothetical protein SAMN05660830_02003 [Halodesulfovibrio aestuarii]